MTMLKSFYKTIENILTLNQPLMSKLQLLRDQLKEFIALDEFRLACLDHVLATMTDSTAANEFWSAPPIYHNSKLKFSIRLVFWPAFYENNPHQHKTWSVTGVFHNHLNINIYKLLDSPARLKKQKSIVAEMGEVGYLLPGCIHSINNATHELSASIHIFNNISDAFNAEENAIWYPSPRKYNLSKGLKERALTTCLAVASKIKTQKSFDIINKIYGESSNTIKFMAIESLYSFDKVHAKQCWEKLESSF